MLSLVSTFSCALLSSAESIRSRTCCMCGMVYVYNSGKACLTDEETVPELSRRRTGACH
jgi:hypothetical protein